MSRPLALSTMWAMQPRFEHDIHAFAVRARELGFDAIEVNASMDAQQARTLINGRVLPVTSIHAPAPLEQHATRGWNRDLNLASTDEAERALAVQYHERTIDLAVEAGARYVVVHLGHVGEGLLPAERTLRAHWADRDSDEAGATDYARSLNSLIAARATLAPAHLPQAARSLEALAAYAEPRGVTLGIESRLWAHELPLPAEAASLLAPYPPHVAGFWYDAGHCEVLSRLGLTEPHEWFALPTVGIHLHDVRGLVDHRAPGAAELDFAALHARLPLDASLTLEIDQHEPDELLARAIEVLRSAGF